jgi:Subtilase family
VEDDMAIDPKIIDQFNLIRLALPDVAAHPADWQERNEDFDYLYRPGTLLMGDAVADDVVRFAVERLALVPLDPDSADERALSEQIRRGEAVVPDGRLLRENVIEGLTKLSFGPPPEPEPGMPDVPRTVPEVLAVLDVEIGRGAVRAEAVVHISPNCCPAHEPEEVPADTVDPFPLPQPGYRCDPPSDGAGVLVSVVDSGLVVGADLEHYWLQDVKGDVEDTFEADGTIKAYAGHGTFVAGCVRVTAPGADVYVDGTMTAFGVTYETGLVTQIAQALGRNPAVIVFAFSAETRNDASLATFDTLYETHIKGRDDIVFVAAVGCNGSNRPNYPAAYRWVLSVGSLSANWRTRADFSNYGGWVDVYAPGEALVNAYVTGTLVLKEHPHAVGEPADHPHPEGLGEREFAGMCRWSGTSFSAPLVAGMIAARVSATGETPRKAANALLRMAYLQAVPGVGPALLPDQDVCGPVGACGKCRRLCVGVCDDTSCCVAPH